jgi:subtilase family serine protease
MDAFEELLEAEGIERLREPPAGEGWEDAVVGERVAHVMLSPPCGSIFLSPLAGDLRRHDGDPCPKPRSARSKGAQQLLRWHRPRVGVVLPPRQRAATLAAVLLGLLVAPHAVSQTLPEPGLDDTSPLPDLVGSNLDITPREPHVKDTVKFCATVRNLGEGDAVSRFDVAFILDNREEAAVRVTDPIRAGHAVQVCKELTFSETSTGPHQWTVRVDSSGGERGEVFETDETNNVPPTKAFTVSAEARPDLRIVEWGVVPRVSRTGQPQFFYASVQNVGNLASEATSIDFWLDIADPSTRIRIPIEPLAPGARTDKPGWSTRPDLRQAGEYTVDFIVDPDGNITEQRETDNTVSTRYTVSVHPAADLTLSDVVLAGEYREHRQLRLDARVLNVGDLQSNAETVLRLYADNGTGEARAVGNATVPRLPTGHGHNATFLFTLPAGNHSLRLDVDPDRRVAELSKDNNSWSVNLSIEAAPVPIVVPNLVVESLDATPDDPRPDEAITLVALVRNDGDARAPPGNVAFYVDGERVAVARSVAIDPGRSVTVLATWSGGEAREYELRAEADVDNDVAERDETDNNLTRSFLLRTRSTSATPTAPTPGTPADPTTTPTPPAGPTTPTPGGGDGAGGAPNGTLEPPVISTIDIATRASPGKLTANIAVQLRNPNLEPLPSLSITYFVDGQRLREQFVQGGLAAAATRAYAINDVDVPPGKHTLRVEVRNVGSTAILATSEATYEAEAGEQGVPAPGAALVALAVAVGAGTIARRKRRGSR